jgi:RNA polymerase sigma factor (sigma-70 family)
MSCTRAKNRPVLSSFRLYMQDIRVESRLTAAEETNLAVAIADGDKEALARMIQANLLLVVTIARDFTRRGLAFDDLVAEGNLGLIRAAKDFQPRFGTRFSTYAGYWIKQAIRHALINTTSTIRLPTHMVTMLTKWRRAERALASGRDETPSFDEVAAVIGLNESQKRMVADARRALYFGPRHMWRDVGRDSSVQGGAGMTASSEVVVTLSVDLFSRLRTRAAGLEVSLDWLVAGLVYDTIEAFVDGSLSRVTVATSRHHQVAGRLRQGRSPSSPTVLPSDAEQGVAPRNGKNCTLRVGFVRADE